MNESQVKQENYFYSINESAAAVCEDTDIPIKTYGITCSQNGNIVESIEDICLNKNALENFIALINEKKLDIKDLKDEIEKNYDDLIDPAR